MLYKLEKLQNSRNSELDVPRFGWQPTKDVRLFVLLRRGTVCLNHSKTLL